MIAVQAQVFDAPRNPVSYTLTGRLTPVPQLQVIEGVVEPIPVSVMDALSREQWPPKVLLHDVSVLENSLPAEVEFPVSLTGNPSAFAASFTAAPDGAIPLRLVPLGVSREHPPTVTTRERQRPFDLALGVAPAGTEPLNLSGGDRDHLGSAARFTCDRYMPLVSSHEPNHTTTAVNSDIYLGDVKCR